MNVTPKAKKVLTIVLVTIFIIVFAVWMMASPRPDHIADTNGEDNYALQSITKFDVAKQDMGARGAISESAASYDFTGLNISDGVKYSSKKFENCK